MSGIEMPPSISWVDLLYQPKKWNGAPFVVTGSPSKVASLTGCSWATVRPAQSPITTCTGAARQAMVSGTTIPARMYFERLPRSHATA